MIKCRDGKHDDGNGLGAERPQKGDMPSSFTSWNLGLSNFFPRQLWNIEKKNAIVKHVWQKWKCLKSTLNFLVQHSKDVFLILLHLKY